MSCSACESQGIVYSFHSAKRPYNRASRLCLEHHNRSIAFITSKEIKSSLESCCKGAGNSVEYWVAFNKTQDEKSGVNCFTFNPSVRTKKQTNCSERRQFICQTNHKQSDASLSRITSVVTNSYAANKANSTETSTDVQNTIDHDQTSIAIGVSVAMVMLLVILATVFVLFHKSKSFCRSDAVARPNEERADTTGNQEEFWYYSIQAKELSDEGNDINSGPVNPGQLDKTAQLKFSPESTFNQHIGTSSSSTFEDEQTVTLDNKKAINSYARVRKTNSQDFHVL